MNRVLPARLVETLRTDDAGPIELPSDIVRQSRQRVRLAALIGLSAYGIFLAFEMSRLSIETGLEHSIDMTHDVLGLILCGSLWLVASVRAIGDRSALAIALFVEVLLCALISVGVSWAGFVRTGHVATLTWVIAVIILFPLLIPTRPRTTLLISALCALTMPAGLWLTTARGLVRADPGDFLAIGLSGAVAVGIAFVAAGAVYGAGRQVAAARAAGSYELVKPLGRGGMGEVWEARHTLLARPAAVKLIRPEMLQGPTEEREAAVRRFAREAQVTANLCSPHTVELFDFGISSDGAFYYAMELLDGMNAEHFVYRFGAIEPRRAVSWLRQICHSLAEAHGNGLVHRDVKPSNIYLCRYGRDVDFVKVLDFGLVKPEAVTEDVGLTSPGVRMGTAGYMAPEQIFGLPLDARADLYAVGCVAYWLIAGTKPFESDSAAELNRLHAQAIPPPLVAKVGGPMPPRLEALIMSCLAKVPADRPRDADTLCEELGRCLDGGRWTTGEAQAWWKAHDVAS